MLVGYKQSYRSLIPQMPGHSMSSARVRYLLFDAESIADGKLLQKIIYPEDDLTPVEAVERCRREQMEKTGKEFIPYTFHVPVSIAIAKIADDFSLIDLVTLDPGQYRPPIIARDFWEGWRQYKRKNTRKDGRFELSLVSFNGRTFDIPMLELAAFRYGIGIGEWMYNKGPSYEHPRNRYNSAVHIDLQEVMTNFGATRFTGGLNLLANLLSKPGKMGIAGHMVQDLYEAGEVEQINDYCRCDVLDTYFVFLRSRVLYGDLPLEREVELVEQAYSWLEEQGDEHPIYREYLDNCEEWENPWAELLELKND